MSVPVEVDQLIEEGLSLYGQGNLDGALALWERALAADPENEQATSYVEYVRQHYDMLTGATNGGDENDSPYAIEDDEYQIEILETPPDGTAPMPTYQDPLDEGWALDDYSRGGGVVPVEDEVEEEPTPTMEIEADEPPPVGFDDATREYVPGMSMTDTVDPGVAEFSDSPDSNPVGFMQQTTNIKPRNLGFVKPIDDSPKPPPTEDEPVRAKPKSSAPPELKMTLRTPDPPADPSLRAALVDDRTNYGPAPRESDPEIHINYDASPPADTPPAYDPRTISVELPAITTAPTTDLDRGVIDDARRTRDMIERETQKIPNARQTLGLTDPDPVVSAPTRELGLRAAIPSSKAVTTPLPMAEDATKTDTQGPPIDPIDARAMAIVDDIDQGAPANEAKDDRTRRRITSLLDRAADWHRQGELDKAVTAVDLALGEDPNSALAQKLIHRNRDTIMTVFQAFLGDLQRTPVLARPLHELGKMSIHPRAAFLLSRIDGTLSIDETLDVSGMPRLEAYRYLCQLLLRGVIR